MPLSSLGGEECSAAQECRKRVCDDKSRDRLEIGQQAALCLEAFAKLGLDKCLAESRDDSAADIDAAAGPERQCQIARNCPKHRAKQMGRLDAKRIFAADRKVGDLRSREAERRHAVELCQCIVEVDEAGARQ